MEKPQQVLLRETVAPLLKLKGLKRSGGTFRAQNARGDAAVLSLRTYRLGEHDLEFYVSVGFAARDALNAAERSGPVSPDRIDITDTYATWHTRLRDPHLSVMDGNDHWGFDLSDTAARDHFRLVLDLGADDLRRRMDLWPTVPVDTLSDPPVFPIPMEVGARSAWFRDDLGRLDYAYTKFSPVVRSTMRVEGEGTFEVVLLWDRLSVMVVMTPEVAMKMTAGREMTRFGPEHDFQPFPDGGLKQWGDVAAGVRVVGADARADLLIERGWGQGVAALSLGHLPAMLKAEALTRAIMHVELIVSDGEFVQSATQEAKVALAHQGSAWYALTPVYG